MFMVNVFGKTSYKKECLLSGIDDDNIDEIDEKNDQNHIKIMTFE